MSKTATIVAIGVGAWLLNELVFQADYIRRFQPEGSVIASTVVLGGALLLVLAVSIRKVSH